MSVVAWVLLSISIVLVPIGIYVLAKYLERKFGLPKKAKKTQQIDSTVALKCVEGIPPYTVL